jgi:uncharacterized protein
MYNHIVVHCKLLCCPNPPDDTNRVRQLFVHLYMHLSKAIVARNAGVVALVLAFVTPASGQVKPSASEVRGYRGLHAAAASGKSTTIRRVLANGANPNARDAYGPTPCHVAAHFKRRTALTLLLRGGCNPNLLERDRYDVATIAAVADDPATLRIALDNGAKATNIILGDGGRRHRNVVGILVDAGANVNIADRSGETPLDHAKSRSYNEIIAILLAAPERRVVNGMGDTVRHGRVVL